MPGLKGVNILARAVCGMLILSPSPVLSSVCGGGRLHKERNRNYTEISLEAEEGEKNGFKPCQEKAPALPGT